MKFAFPSSSGDTKGMSLRDYLAAKAMQALVSADFAKEELTYQEIAHRAYYIADKMLEVRS